jgi:hypothetical protein
MNWREQFYNMRAAIRRDMIHTVDAEERVYERQVEGARHSDSRRTRMIGSTRCTSPTSYIVSSRLGRSSGASSTDLSNSASGRRQGSEVA